MRPLHPDDLIDDRALRSADDDAFRHLDFVGELAELVRATKTPANIALYAPWGSGKTGLAYLLESEFEEDSKVCFVRFDAFKYAEAPLRRHFIAQVAADLDLSDEYKDALYRNETHTTLALPPKEVWRLAGWFIGVLAAVVGLAFLGCAIYGALARGGFEHEFRDATKWLMPKVFAPAALFAAMIALIGKTFAYDRTVSAPASEEEFEEQFEALVEDAIGVEEPNNTDDARTIDDAVRRLVIFIDELDRCSPEEVVATLETLWTFFDLSGCVFIVAADQQVLEEALTRKARQATPSDSTSPYYSAGSAYLDKIFHYQLSLPPLKPQRLTSFALGLVEDRGGLWSRASKDADLGDVISILVPSHVRSPRRVKALLNTFATLYRIAEQRATENVLGDVSTRVVELAKLACLRVEFPLFAAELVQEPRMTEFMLLASEEEGEEDNRLPAYVADHVQARARRWAAGELEADRLISRPASEVDVDDDDVTQDDHALVREQHANQLLAYLSKSRAIPGPGRDLIYLESAGFEVGLDPAVADELEVAAVDGRRAQVRRIVDRLEADEQLSAYRLLAHLARHSAIGLEGQNTIGALMEALAAHKDALAPIADEVCGAIAHQSYELADSDLTGALALSLESEHQSANDLCSRVVTDDRTLRDTGLALKLIQAADRIPGYPDFVARAVIAVARQDPEAAAGAISGAPIERMVAATDEISGEWLTDELEDEDEAGEVSTSFIDLLDALIAAPGERKAIAESLAKAYLNSGHTELIDAVDSRLEQLGLGTHHGFARALLVGAAGGEPHRIIRWLQAIDPTQLPKLGDVTDRVDPLLSVIWSSADKGILDEEDVRSAMSAVERFHGSGILGPCTQTEAAVSQTLGEATTSETAVENRRSLFPLARRLAEMELISAQGVADSALTMASNSFASAATVTDALASAVLDLVDRFGSDASEEALDAFLQSGVAVQWAGVAQSAWLIAGAERDESPISPEEVARLAANRYFDRGLAIWLSRFAQGVDETLAGIAPIKADPPTTAVAAALSEHCEWWIEKHPERHLTFVTRLVQAAPVEPVDAGFVTAARFSDLAVDKQVAILVEAGGAARDADESRSVFALLPVLSGLKKTDVDGVLIGLFVPLAQRQTVGDLNLAIEHLSWLKRGTQSARDATRRALRAAADAVGSRSELEEAMVRTGLSRKKGFLGLGGHEDV